MPAWLLAVGGGRALLAAVIVLGLVLGGWWLHAAGRRAEQVDGLRSTVKSVVNRNDVDREIDRLPDGASADRLRRDWSRD